MSSDFLWFLRWFRSFRRLERENARVRAQQESERKRLEAEIEAERALTAEWRRFAPPGHFYSPLASNREVTEAFERGGFGPPFAGIDLNESGQATLLKSFLTYYREQPFPEYPTGNQRYYFKNDSYGQYDAIMLYCMLRHAQPKRVIEIGCGFSSAAMLDFDDLGLGSRIDFTFIDPDMTRLRPLLRTTDTAHISLIEKPVQDVALETFAALGNNDILFIDSSHVSKIGSDVNRIYFDVLPMLRSGVLIHIHDVTGNLEYPRDWLECGRSWNELYLLRAFLMYNTDFKIVLFTSLLYNTRNDWLKEHMPMCAQGGGGQLWLRKLPADPIENF